MNLRTPGPIPVPDDILDAMSGDMINHRGPEYKEILYEIEDGLAEITLNNPEIMNAMSETMLQEWVDALEKSEGDNSVKVVMVTGKGRAFCAGGNVKNIEGSTRPEGRRPGGPRSGPFGGIITAAKNLKKPYIAR